MHVGVCVCVCARIVFGHTWGPPRKGMFLFPIDFASVSGKTCVLENIRICDIVALKSYIRSTRAYAINVHSIYIMLAKTRTHANAIENRLPEG